MAIEVEIFLIAAIAGLAAALIYTRMNLRSLEYSYEKKLEARTKLVRAAAHELKQPLNVIGGMAGLLRQERSLDRSVNKGIAEKLELSVRDLQDTLIDTHEVFELSTGGLGLDLEPVEIRSESKILIRELNKHFEQNGQRVSIIGGHLPEIWVETDKARLLQCLRTLLTEAAVQCREGQVRLSYKIQQREDARCRISFVILDDGPRIDQRQVSQLFDSSAHHESGPLNGRPSALVSLCLSAGLAELMGGRLVARTNPGSGMAFEYVILADTCPPLGEADEIEHGSFRGHDDPLAFDDLRVLLVDDNEANLFVLQEYILPLGFGTIVCAGGGEEAVQRAEAQAFDLILMDLAMPGIDGFQASRMIREGRMSAAAPIVAVSADFMRSGDSRLIAASIDGFVPKPIVQADLFGAILKVAPQIAEAARLRGVRMKGSNVHPFTRAV